MKHPSVVFTVMWDIMNHKYDVKAKRNHLRVPAEKVVQFLNKTVSIASNDRPTVDVFVEIGVAADNA